MQNNSPFEFIDLRNIGCLDAIDFEQYLIDNKMRVRVVDSTIHGCGWFAVLEDNYRKQFGNIWSSMSRRDGVNGPLAIRGLKEIMSGQAYYKQVPRFKILGIQIYKYIKAGTFPHFK